MTLKRVRNRRDDLSHVQWQDMERLLVAHYRQAGYEVEHVGTAGSRSRYDGGIDLKLRRDDEYIVVQCKHWNAYKVPHNPVHELIGIMDTERATGAILVTSGEFTDAAYRAAGKQARIQLVDGDMLREMIAPLMRRDTADAVTDAWQPMLAGRQLPASRSRDGWRTNVSITGGRKRHRSTAARNARPLLKIVAALFLLWAAQHFFRSQEIVKRSAAPVSPVVATPHVSTPDRNRHAEALAPVRPVSSTQDASGKVEMSDPPQDADEAISVLAPNTPEM